MIEVEDLRVQYGSATALDGVSLSVAAGEMVALVGANGAGKSTLLNTLSGVVQSVSGRIRIAGRFAHVPEGRQLFPDLSVDDNLRLGAFRTRNRDTTWVYELIPELERVRKQLAGSLSGGQQQMVAVARGLMSQPDVIAIDEMSLGLAPLIVRDLARYLSKLNAERGLAVLLVEQSARLALSLCSKAYVLETGRIVAAGPAAELANSAFVIDAYLGSGLEERA
ncbi:MAG TPA: ABC transporter ATP-binding protein [Polyangiaceae bacterium]|nr:ABC transporter ATP-binding protein [Polyangiaceae bacterium]